MLHENQGTCTTLFVVLLLRVVVHALGTTVVLLCCHVVTDLDDAVRVLPAGEPPLLSLCACGGERETTPSVVCDPLFKAMARSVPSSVPPHRLLYPTAREVGW